MSRSKMVVLALAVTVVAAVGRMTGSSWNLGGDPGLTIRQ
jgi:hypothetical protein